MDVETGTGNWKLETGDWQLNLQSRCVEPAHRQTTQTDIVK
jgi:hypothetical protein